MRVGALQLWPLLFITPRTPAGDGLLQVGVGQDDVGALAAQLLVHALDGGRGVARHLDAGARAAGERHHVHLGVAG
jgi:hypothetical protein